MLHQWLNVAGLTSDFFGVVLLAYEWWIALKSDERELAIAQQEYREQELRSRMTPAPMLDKLHNDMRFSRQIQRTRSTLGMRRGWFVLALVLICGGFLLQIAGSWPGMP